jgi:hypothetical protein
MKARYRQEKGGRPMASVTYDHVTKAFGEVIAVNDLDIKIEDKEFLVWAVRMWENDGPSFISWTGRNHRRSNSDW